MCIHNMLPIVGLTKTPHQKYVSDLSSLRIDNVPTITPRVNNKSSLKKLITNKSRIAHVELSQYVKRLQNALKINMISETSVNHQFQ